MLTRYIEINLEGTRVTEAIVLIENARTQALQEGAVDSTDMFLSLDQYGNDEPHYVLVYQVPNV